MLKPTRHNEYVNRVAENYVIVYVLRGTGQFVDATGNTHSVRAGDVLHHLPNHHHSLIPDADGQWAEVYIQADRRFYPLLEATDCDALAEPVLQPGLEARLVERFEYVHHALREADDVALELAPAWLLEIIFLAQGLTRRGGSEPDATLVEQACLLLGRNLEKRRNLPSVAQELGVSYERFRKVFVARMGVAPRTYRIHRRIDRARELIEQDGLSNKQVAYALGYADPFTFSKQFKAVVGVSPAVFRHRMR